MVSFQGPFSFLFCQRGGLRLSLDESWSLLNEGGQVSWVAEFNSGAGVLYPEGQECVELRKGKPLGLLG